MGYTEEKQKIISYVTHRGHIIGLNYDKSNVKQYSRLLAVYPDSKKLIIRYPGYKTTSTKCDYCVCLVDEGNERAVSHAEIMQDLYNKTTPSNYPDMKAYIEAVARIGREAKTASFMVPIFPQSFSYAQLTDLMFYVAIQEDINYPDYRYQGRKMCFFRYLEAIYCKINNQHSLQEAISRAETHGKIPPMWTNVGDLYDNVDALRR